MYGKRVSFICHLTLDPLQIAREVMYLVTTSEHGNVFVSSCFSKWTVSVKVGEQLQIVQGIIQTNDHSFDIFIGFKMDLGGSC